MFVKETLDDLQTQLNPSSLRLTIHDNRYHKILQMLM